MKSTEGRYLIALDQVRALAAFIVFSWHFLHSDSGHPIAFNYTPNLFPLAILDEGHTGVALFMALSGYLFSFLLDGKSIRFIPFLVNRALRLIPLLFLTLSIYVAIKVFKGESLLQYLGLIAQGIIFPTLPNGGWSITVELHFYLLLPLLLFLLRKNIFFLWILLIASIAIRFFLWNQIGEVQQLAYWTIIGRLDQFILGMLAFTYRKSISGRTILITLLLLSFCFFYWVFDSVGGFYSYPSYPSSKAIWIILPTIEGLVFGSLIAWYSESFDHTKTSKLGKAVASIGGFAYAIYLFHFFFVFEMAKFIHENIMNLSNFYIACLWALASFILMWPIGWLSFYLYERHFLKYRKNYLKNCDS